MPLFFGNTPASGSAESYEDAFSSGSADNVKPELVLEAFAAHAGFSLPEFALLIHRKELYANSGTAEEPHFVSLEALGEEF